MAVIGLTVVMHPSGDLEVGVPDASTGPFEVCAWWEALNG